MLLGVSGDCHSNINNIEVFKQYLQLLSSLEQESDKVLILGDLFHNHSVVRVEILNLWLDFFSKTKKPYILLVGNHDEVAPGSTVHALEAFKNYSNVKVVDFSDQIDGSIFVSYCKDSEAFAKELDKYSGNYKYLFCHQDFDGAKYDNSFFAPNGVKTATVQRFEHVIAGHIHRGQQFANIWYPGNAYAMNFNDANMLKSLWILNTENNERKQILTNLPEYIVKEFSAIEDVVPWLSQQGTVNKYKIVLNASKASTAAFCDSKEYQDIRRQYQVILSPQYLDVNSVEIKIADSLSLDKMLEKYILEVMATDQDRGLLLEKALKLLK